MSATYTRKIGKIVLVPRPVKTTYGYAPALVALPISRVLRELPCDLCKREIERGELVVRERIYDYWRTTCDLCGDWISGEDLL